MQEEETCFLTHVLFPFGPVSVVSETPPLFPIEPYCICGSLILPNGKQPKESQRAEWWQTGICLLILLSDFHKKKKKQTERRQKTI